MKPEEVVALVKEKGIQFIDMKFNDLPGLWQHFTIPAGELTDEVFREGLGFDGSSIRGFQEIQESDMILIPDPDTAIVDPICSVPTLSLICDIYDPITKEPYTRDPRFVAKKAESYLKESGIADTSYWGPEMEFFIFDDVRFDQTVHCGYYFVDSIEGEWNTGREEKPNLGYKPRYKEGYFPVPPHDSLHDLRSEIVLAMLEIGNGIEVHHHEVASGGQGEIDMKFDTLTKMADKCMKYKYIVKNIARRHNKVATFMPKPLFQDNGSGMHTHQSLWKDGTNLFFDPDGYAQISQTAKYYIGGLLEHAPALMAFCAPTTNSYKRLVPGFEAPVNLTYSSRNRSAAIRIPMYSNNPKSKRIEFRPPDCTCNPYLAFAAMLMAGLDGIEREIDPGEPIEKNIYKLEGPEAHKVKTVPGSLEEALIALEQDHDFLLKGNVFTADLLDVWIRYKREREIDAIKLRPHPYEFHLYFDL
ncbi:glutamine synthetase 1 [Thermacetogenium phaeum DSM 12270]|uniref:Glutamine synthetase n=1 Tax=Thermacetogenium phaeum (strain ATCC BAA-254 / DSM 26808 / PB) TaxID=1089553 RepID=K4LG82_THEPS|nr:type I glutamate--ammonia ligase [Thermacetogenium phaeum]AFV11092.1 glutamine synthetase 1 [Thermacetogenium phaeum DSM 12270]